MAQRQQGSTATGATMAAIIVLVLASMGYYQYVYAPTIPTSTTATTATTPSNIKTVSVNITLNAAGACGGPSGVQTSQPTTCNAYAPNPTRLVIGVNNSVIFNNVDSAVHTATANDKSFDTGILNAGQQSSPIVIDKPGQYPYFCAVHPWMKGELIVVQGSGTPAQSSSTSASASTTSGASSASSSSSETSSAAGVRVSIPNGTSVNPSSTGYAPGRIVVVIGVNSTVTWVNDDTAPHTVTATDKGFDSGNLGPGQTFTHTFDTPGTYDYICLYHSFMKGVVVVLKG